MVERLRKNRRRTENKDPGPSSLLTRISVRRRLAIGGTVLLDAIFGDPIGGASVNSVDWQILWIFLGVPLGFIAVLTFMGVGRRSQAVR